jgi:hypothetical protein
MGIKKTFQKERGKFLAIPVRKRVRGYLSTERRAMPNPLLSETWDNL